jgi:hypothetical protein
MPEPPDNAMKKPRPGRISLSADDAEHVYEWLRMYWRGDAQKFGGCLECERTGRRLERLIGPAAVRQVARVVKLHPGRAPLARTKKKHAKPTKG